MSEKLESGSHGSQVYVFVYAVWSSAKQQGPKVHSLLGYQLSLTPLSEDGSLPAWVRAAQLTQK